MRIGVVCPYNIFKPGGVQSHVEAQIKILRARGHTVTLITPRPRKYHDPAPDGVYFIGASARVKAQSTSVDISSTVDDEEIDKLFSTIKPDVLHFHEPFIPFVARQIITRATCPTVSSFHAALPESLVSRTITSLGPYLNPAIESSDAVLAVSPAAAAHLVDMCDGDIKYVSNGIDLSSYKEDKNVKRDENTILFVGRLEKRKGARTLIDAYKLIKQKNPKAKLKIAGDGQLRDSLVRYCEANEISDVEFLGYVEDDKKQDLMRRCSVYCTPALFGESFGIVLLEAMALGTPIVAHANPGYEWVMKETGRLSLVNAYDTPEFARRLELLMEDQKLRDLWQEWAREYVKQFSYEKVIDEYEKIYHQVIKQAKK